MQIKKTKYIMYHCDPGCSGFADRVKGKINFLSILNYIIRGGKNLIL